MANALFAFEDAHAGQSAARQLVKQGLNERAVKVHMGDGTPSDKLGRQIDEQVTGGLLTNLLDLFQGVFDWGASPHEASAYEETVRRGGAVVSVDLNREDERLVADEVMRQAGCDQRTEWRATPPG